MARSGYLKGDVNDAGVRGIEEVSLRVMRVPEVLEAVGISRSTLRRWVEAGCFPEPVRLGPRLIGWRASEIREWLDGRERVALKA